MVAVPPMNPVMVERDRKSTMSPNLHRCRRAE
jgi:hypothetical protein